MSLRVFVKAVVVALSLLAVLQFGGRSNRPSGRIAAPSTLLSSLADAASDNATSSATFSTTTGMAVNNQTDVCEPPADAALACAYVQQDQCKKEHEFIDYMRFHYCTMSGSAQPASFVLLFLWFVALLYMLGSTAEGHFCPALSHISDTLRLSPDVAGITILAFGNGSPDVFSIFAGVQQGNFNIALNELTGSGCFVTMCVVSAVALVSNARLDRYPFLRDASLYFCAQALVFGIVFDGLIMLWESIVLLLFYFAYVALVVVVQVVQRRRARRRAAAADGDDDAADGKTAKGGADDDNDADDGKSFFNDDDDGALGWGASRDVQSLLNSMKSFDDPPDEAPATPRSRPIAMSVVPPAAAPKPQPPPPPQPLQPLLPAAALPARSPISRRARSVTSALDIYEGDELDHEIDADHADDADDAAPVDLEAIKSSLLSISDFSAIPSRRARRTRSVSTIAPVAVAATAATTDSIAVNRSSALGVAAGLRAVGTNLASAVEAERVASQLRRDRRHLRRREFANEPAVLRRRGIHLDPLRHRVVLGGAAPVARPVPPSSAAGAAAGAADDSGVPSVVRPGGAATTSSGDFGDDDDDDSDSDSDDAMLDEPDAAEGNIESHMSARSLSALRGRRAVVARRPWIVRAYRGVRLHARDVTEWREKGRFGKAVFAVMSPLHLLLWLSVPHVEDGVWHRGITSVSLVGAVGVISLALRLWDVGLGPVPLPVLLLGLAAIAAGLFFYFSSKYKPPKYRLPLVLLAFFVSILWIYMTANELVSLLKFFGIVFDISTGILGLTVLAWGNSIGDFVANTVVARQGFPEMAISAAFGGPLFNMVFGLGMAVTFANIRHFPEPLVVDKITNQSLTAFMFLSFGLLASLITIPLTKFVIRRWYAGVLITLYVSATTCGLLAEFGVLDFGLGRGPAR